ncbi:type I methionyl aminopeptidase [Patescibacteria group bacterium]|nr:type I methionyl aminopeptidase [Patescibacteria group bacterium]
MSNIPLKNPSQVEIMAQNAHDLAQILDLARGQAKSGMPLKELDIFVETQIKARGGQSAFQKVPHYDWATCINLNQGVVHGIPDGTKLKKGDLVSVDSGLWRDGWFSDMSRSWQLGSADPQKEAFLAAGREVLSLVVAQARAGNRVGHLSQTIEKGLLSKGFWPVHSLTGHGIGRKLHELPTIPCFMGQEITKTPILRSGMVLAVEVIYTQNETELETGSDGWTIQTKDGSWGGLEEDMVLVGKEGARILTKSN